MKQLNDINISLTKNLVNGSVSSVTNKRAIAQYIIDMLDTNTLEIPFKEWQGSGLSALLGEACSNLTASVIIEQIRGLIEKYIPYIELQDITYKIDQEAQLYVIYLYYNIVSNTEIIEQTLTLSTTV